MRLVVATDETVSATSFNPPRRPVPSPESKVPLRQPSRVEALNYTHIVGSNAAWGALRARSSCHPLLGAANVSQASVALFCDANRRSVGGQLAYLISSVNGLVGLPCRMTY